MIGPARTGRVRRSSVGESRTRLTSGLREPTIVTRRSTAAARQQVIPKGFCKKHVPLAKSPSAEASAGFRPFAHRFLKRGLRYVLARAGNRSHHGPANRRAWEAHAYLVVL